MVHVLPGVGEPGAPPTVVASLTRSLAVVMSCRPARTGPWQHGAVAVPDVHALRRGSLVAAAVLVRRLILLAAAVGVVAMHQLAGPPGGHTHEHGALAHAVLEAPEHCPHPAGSDCPDRLHGHPGQVCQPLQGTEGPDGVPVMAAQPTTPTEPPLLTARTAAREAGDGTGCGPPHLTELSLRRI